MTFFGPFIPTFLHGFVAGITGGCIAEQKLREGSFLQPSLAER